MVRFQILEDGQGRWAVVDNNRSDDPAPVFETRGEAEVDMERKYLAALLSKRATCKNDGGTCTCIKWCADRVGVRVND